MSDGHESDIPVTDRITDVSDQATETEHKSLAYHLYQARLKAKRQQEPRKDGTFEHTHCAECDNEIGAQRLAVAINNLYCVVCESAREHRARRGLR